MTNKEWNPQKFKCKQCEDIIWSEYPGQYTSCKCGGIAVDQTRHYERFIGNPKLFEEVKTQ